MITVWHDRHPTFDTDGVFLALRGKLQSLVVREEYVRWL